MREILSILSGSSAGNLYNNNSYRFNKLGSSGIADTLLSSNAPTKQAPISSFTAVSKISIEAKAPSIIL